MNNSAIDFMKSTSYKGSIPGLERLEVLLSLLENPERKLKYIHVTGTNGKGSVCKMLAEVFSAAGYVTGLFTSPCLEKVNEQIMVGNNKNQLAMISDEDYEYVAKIIKEKALLMTDLPTEFELLVAAAFLHFVRKKCDIVIMETGMGGTLDATNVIPSPEAAIITSIGYDHIKFLGDSLVKIAEHKAGIIKEGCKVIYQRPNDLAAFGFLSADFSLDGAIVEETNEISSNSSFSSANSLQDEAIGKESADFSLDVAVEKVIVDRANNQEAQLFPCDSQDIIIEDKSIDGYIFSYKNHKSIKLRLLGEHQVRNATLVLETIDNLRDKYNKITDEIVRNVLSKVFWPARMEIIIGSSKQASQIYILDGGHNKQCIEAVTKTFDDLFPGEKFVFLTGVMADKDYYSMYDMLNRFAHAYVTVTPDNSRALPAEKLKEFLETKSSATVFAASSIPEALNLANNLAKPDKKICVIGSLYMMGEARKQISIL